MLGKSSRIPTARARKNARTARSKTPGKRSRSGRRSAGEPKLIPTTVQHVRKWIRVKRSPAPGISFSVHMWIPIDKMTKEERQEYLPDSIDNNTLTDPFSLEAQDISEDPPMDLDDSIPIEFSEDLMFSDTSGFTVAANPTNEMEPPMKMSSIEEYPLR